MAQLELSGANSFNIDLIQKDTKFIHISYSLARVDRFGADVAHKHLKVWNNAWFMHSRTLLVLCSCIKRLILEKCITVFIIKLA